MSEPALRVVDLGHAYGDTPVLDGVSFDVAPGELVAVLGASGCGKTTLLRSIAGLLTPARGRIEVGGRLVCADGREQVPVERRGVGLVFQEYALFPHMTVAENIAFGLPGGRDTAGRVPGLLALAGLEGLASRRPAQLSGGQQQRVALLRALAPGPSLLLLDEPFSNVDAERRGDLGLALRRILAAEGAAALLVTHDRGDALQLADRVVAVVRGSLGGRVAQVGCPEVLYRQPASVAVARLTGPVSVLPGTGRGPVAETAVGSLPLRTPAQGPVQLLLRPEQIAFVPDPAGPARVVHATFLGRGHRLVCETPVGPVVVEAPSPPADPRGRLSLHSPAWAVSAEDPPTAAALGG